MIGFPGTTLANIDAAGSLTLNSAPRGVTSIERDRGQVSRLPSPLAAWFTPEPGTHPDRRHGGGIEAWLAVWERDTHGGCQADRAEGGPHDPCAEVFAHEDGRRPPTVRNWATFVECVHFPARSPA
jgi:hypothetical protein